MAARMVSGTRRCHRITSVLSVSQRVVFKTALLVSECVRAWFIGSTPVYARHLCIPDTDTSAFCNDWNAAGSTCTYRNWTIPLPSVPNSSFQLRFPLPGLDRWPGGIPIPWFPVLFVIPILSRCQSHVCMYVCMYGKNCVLAAAYSLDCHEDAMINCRLYRTFQSSISYYSYYSSISLHLLRFFIHSTTHTISNSRQIEYDNDDEIAYFTVRW